LLWSQWSLDRIILLFVGIAYLLIGLQVALSHYRQNFHHKIMWAPVVEAPLIGLLSLLAVGLNSRGWLVAAQAAYWIGTASGLLGFALHLKGVGVRVGGYALRNFLVGPPVVLPLLFAAMSVLGLLAAWGW